MAKPTEDSVAERTKMKNTKIYPTISSKYNENVIKLRFIDNNGKSVEIRSTAGLHYRIEEI